MTKRHARGRLVQAIEAGLKHSNRAPTVYKKPRVSIGPLIKLKAITHGAEQNFKFVINRSDIVLTFLFHLHADLPCRRLLLGFSSLVGWHSASQAMAENSAGLYWRVS